MQTHPKLAPHLRAATAEAHSSAEGSQFVKRFVAGELDRETYQRYLLALREIYLALEAGCSQNAEHPALRPLQFGELPRTESIAADIRFFETPAELSPPAAANEYAAHLRGLAADRPVLLVAHSYVRYLGDLSGGQALAKWVTKTFDLTKDEGVDFYRFPGIASLKKFKDGYREALNDLPLSEDDHMAVIEEAKAAFRWTGKVFDAL